MSILRCLTSPAFGNEPVKINTDDILAVQWGEGERRIYTRDALIVIGKVNPAEVAEIDRLGGKPFTRLAVIPKFGSAQRYEFERAATIAVSTVDGADVRVTRYTDAVLSRARLSGAFTSSALPQDVSHGTRMHYGALAIGQNAPVFVAHLDATRIMAFNR